MAKQFKDKIAALKAVASGKQSIASMRPPQHHAVSKQIKRGVITYHIGMKVLTEQEYEVWYKENVREDIDTLILFTEVRIYKDEQGQIKEDEWDEDSVDNLQNKIEWRETLTDDEGEYQSTVLEIHQEPIQAEKKKEEEIAQPIKEAAVAPVLRPLSEHIAFNEYIINKLNSSW